MQTAGRGMEGICSGAYNDQPGDGWARWCLHRGNLQSVECQASPILPGELLKDAIWDRAAGAGSNVCNPGGTGYF